MGLTRDNPGIGAPNGNSVRLSPFWRPRSRANYLICYIDVTAFVSVMLVFLFTFMVRVPICSWSISQRPVDMARVDSPISMAGADREDAMLIAVTRDNKVFFGSDPVQPADLPVKIRASVARGSEQKVYIKADARAKYAWVAEVVESAHEAGIEKIGFLVDQRKAPPVATSR